MVQSVLELLQTNSFKRLFLNSKRGLEISSKFLSCTFRNPICLSILIITLSRRKSGIIKKAGPPGFEPRLAESKSAALPLRYGPKWRARQDSNL